MLKAFILSDLEMFRFDTFKKEHEEKCNLPSCISFTVTEYGHIVHVECLGCGMLEEITDMRKLTKGV